MQLCSFLSIFLYLLPRGPEEKQGFCPNQSHKNTWHDSEGCVDLNHQRLPSRMKGLFDFLEGFFRLLVVWEMGPDFSRSFTVSPTSPRVPSAILLGEVMAPIMSGLFQFKRVVRFKRVISLLSHPFKSTSNNAALVLDLHPQGRQTKTFFLNLTFTTWMVFSKVICSSNSVENLWRNSNKISL